MLKLISTILLSCCLCSTAIAHEWYTGRKSISGSVCCNGKDCFSSVILCTTDKGEQGVIIPNISPKCLPYTDADVDPEASPDGENHACYWGGKVRCVIFGAAS